MSELKVVPTYQEDIAPLKTDYLQDQTAPLDGMWQAFSGMGQPFGIEDAESTLGYGILNGDKKIIEFHACAPEDAAAVFQALITSTGATGAFAATSDAPFASLALDQQQTVRIQALMYEHGGEAVDADFPADCSFSLLQPRDLNAVVDFGFETIGADKGWLEGYFGNLIERGELFALKRGENIIATGERRVSDTQKPYADVGMIVGTNERKKGLATQILRALATDCFDKGLKPICSTERDNIGAQKAIERAGFFSRHRILEISF